MHLCDVGIFWSLKRFLKKKFQSTVTSHHYSRLDMIKLISPNGFECGGSYPHDPYWNDCSKCEQNQKVRDDYFWDSRELFYERKKKEEQQFNKKKENLKEKLRKHWNEKKQRKRIDKFKKKDIIKKL